jgi:hypothetical protein
VLCVDYSFLTTVLYDIVSCVVCQIKDLENKHISFGMSLSALETSTSAITAGMKAFQRDLGSTDSHWKDLENLEQKLDKEVSGWLH